MSDAIEFVYTSKEVSVSVGIATSTLRTWCLKLEAADYIIKRSDDGKRVFFERDITALRMMKELLDKKHSSEYAVEQVLNRFNVKTHSVTDSDSQETAISTVTPSVEPRYLRASDFMDEIRQAMKEEVRQEIAVAMEEQTKRIEQSIDRRDQQITEVLRELQTKRKQSKWKFWSK